MKLFYKKDYFKLLRESEDQKENFIRKIVMKEARISDLDNQVFELIKDNSCLKDDIVDLEIQIKSLEEEIKDLKSDRYLIKKIPSGRPPKTQKTKISLPMKPSVRRHMKEVHD